MNSRLPIGFPNNLNTSRGGSSRSGGLFNARLLIVGALAAILILLFVLGSTGTTSVAEADESRVDLVSIVGPALTRAGYGDVMVESDGRTVTLSGELPTRTDVIAADAVVKSISEVAFVQNNLSHPGDSADIPIPGETGTPSAISSASSADLELQLRLATIAAVSPVIFQPRSVDISAESQSTIDQVVQLLNENPDLRVEVGGHTDSSGEPEINEVLAQDRADAVMAALITAGIEERRLTAVGYGDSRPVVSNDTPDGRARNRRIEFLILP